VGLCALTQRLVHLLELRPVQFRPAACPLRPTYPIWPILPPCLEPSAHALTTDVEFTGDLSLSLLRLKDRQFESSSAVQSTASSGRAPEACFLMIWRAPAPHTLTNIFFW
jgi:hypothetical protein